MLNSVGGLTRKRYLRRVEPLVNTVLMSYGLHIFLILSANPKHRADIPWWVFGYYPPPSYLGFLEPILYSLGSCYDGGFIFLYNFLWITFHTPLWLLLLVFIHFSEEPKCDQKLVWCERALPEAIIPWGVAKIA